MRIVMRCAGLLAIVATALLAPAAGQASASEGSPSPGARVGTPVMGAHGVQRTTAQLEAAGSKAPPSPHPSLRPRSGPRAKQMPGGANVPASGAAVGTPRTAVSSSFSFDGPTWGSSSTDNLFPPDTMGDVGPSQFVVAINSRIRSYDKATGAADGGIDIAEDSFWAPVMTPVNGTTITCNFTSDPHIRYDRLTERWIVVMIDVPDCDGQTNNRVMVAASDGPTISGSTVWTFHYFQATSGEFADYPTLGVDANALYIGVNDFSLSTGSFDQTDGFVVRKSTILGAGSIVETPFTALTDNTHPGPYTPQGVDNADPSATVGYFVGVDSFQYGQLDLRRVTDPGGTPSISGNLTVSTPATDSPILVPHLGNTGGSNGRLDAIDDRLFAASMDSNGHIWTAHDIGVNSSGVAANPISRDASRWYELTNVGTTPALAQSGTVYDSAASNPLSYWMPTVAVSGEGVMAIGGSVAGNNEHADAWYSGRLPGDPAGQVDAPTTYTASTFAYNPPGDPGGSYGRRWGDYSLTRVDPEDDQTLWTIQEYAQATNTWGVRIARLSAPPPATPASPSPSVLQAGSSSTIVTLGGTSSGGSAYYDPGAGFSKRLSVDVGCGIVVNGVTFDGPTSLTLDLDTTSATSGSCDVTVTNPDGQSKTATGLLHVTTGLSLSTLAPWTAPTPITPTGSLSTNAPWTIPPTPISPGGDSLSANTPWSTPTPLAPSGASLTTTAPPTLPPVAGEGAGEAPPGVPTSRRRQSRQGAGTPSSGAADERGALTVHFSP